MKNLKGHEIFYLSLLISIIIWVNITAITLTIKNWDELDFMLILNDEPKWFVIILLMEVFWLIIGYLIVTNSDNESARKYSIFYWIEKAFNKFHNFLDRTL